MVKPGSVKKFVYIPDLGFFDDIWSAIGEVPPEDDLFPNLQETSSTDEIIRKRLQKEYPGCRIIHDGNRWEVIPEE